MLQRTDLTKNSGEECSALHAKCRVPVSVAKSVSSKSRSPHRPRQGCGGKPGRPFSAFRRHIHVQGCNLIVRQRVTTKVSLPSPAPGLGSTPVIHCCVLSHFLLHREAIVTLQSCPIPMSSNMNFSCNFLLSSKNIHNGLTAFLRWNACETGPADDTYPGFRY
jgi:hypothetical protein